MIHFREVEKPTQSHTADLGQSQESSQEPSQAWQSPCCPAPAPAPAHRTLLSPGATPQATGAGGRAPTGSADPVQTAVPSGAGKLASLGTVDIAALGKGGASAEAQLWAQDLSWHLPPQPHRPERPQSLPSSAGQGGAGGLTSSEGRGTLRTLC